MLITDITDLVPLDTEDYKHITCCGKPLTVEHQTFRNMEWVNAECPCGCTAASITMDTGPAQISLCHQHRKN